MCVAHTHTYHIFFIYLSVDGQLGCFDILANVNYAAVNIGIHVSFQISVFIFFWYVHPRSGIAGSYGKFMSNFKKETAKWLIKLGVPFYISTTNIWQFLFIHFGSICYHVALWL